jgi:hypothetical protein
VGLEASCCHNGTDTGLPWPITGLCGAVLDAGITSSTERPSQLGPEMPKPSRPGTRTEQQGSACGHIVPQCWVGTPNWTEIRQVDDGAPVVFAGSFPHTTGSFKLCVLLPACMYDWLTYTKSITCSGSNTGGKGPSSLDAKALLHSLS